MSNQTPGRATTTTVGQTAPGGGPAERRVKRRKLYVDAAACLTVHWPRKDDEGKAHCPRTHHALGMVYIPPPGGWRWVTFGANPLSGDADDEKAAVRALRRCWGLY